MRHFIFYLVLLLNGSLIAQKNPQTSICYNPNLSNMPLGLNIFYQPKQRFTVFGDFKYFKKKEGTERPDAEPGTGIYAPGEWGNSGSTDPEVVQFYPSYSYIQRTSWHVGIGWNVLHRNFLSVTPYLGFGEYTYESFKEYYTTIQDVSSGVNVIGYQEISLQDHFDLERTPSATFGILVRWKYLAVGLGYDTQPSGISFSIGFNMTNNQRTN
jgi:hypothetical protein